MEYLGAIVIFLFGIIIGSFLNVCIYRIPKEESIAFPPSHCGNCSTRLKGKDLVPIFSYIFLKGRCRYCGEKVSIQYPLIEFLTGILFVGVYLAYGLSFATIKFIALVAVLIVIAIIDFKTEDIYDSTIVTGFIFGIILLICEYFSVGSVNFTSVLMGTIIPAGILALVIIATKGFGWGDVELLALIGFFLGFKLTILTLFISVVVGGIVAIGIMIFNKDREKRSMAFGPYIAIGSYIALIYGQQLIEWYINIFF